VAASAGYVTVRDERHAMLRRATVWHSLTTSYVLAVLCNVEPVALGRSRAGAVIAEVLAGKTSLVV
jgi:hypothetical protein